MGQSTYPRAIFPGEACRSAEGEGDAGGIPARDDVPQGGFRLELIIVCRMFLMMIYPLRTT